jgi:IclR family KDG regulon transcriptional repressor
MAEKYFINSIQRAFDILELFAQNGKELGISDIARSLGLHKSMVHRIVSTLQYKGILEQNPDNGRYRLGLKLYRLGLSLQDDNELIIAAETSLENLTEKTGETSNLVQLDGNMCVYVSQKVSSRMVKMFTKPGAKVYPHCNGAGKVLLSGLSESDVLSIINANGLPRYTENTITSVEALMEELSIIRRQGYAIDNEEREEGVMCIAAPVKDRYGTIIAAISISGPASRFEQERMDSLISNVRDTAFQISHMLGYVEQG